MTGESDFHNLSDARSWALHSEVAARLPAHPELVERAQRRIQTWMGQKADHPYAADWHQLLSLPLSRLTEALCSKDDRMCALRQASPFAGALDNATRWRILKRPEFRPREAS